LFCSWQEEIVATDRLLSVPCRICNGRDPPSVITIEIAITLLICLVGMQMCITFKIGSITDMSSSTLGKQIKPSLPRGLCHSRGPANYVENCDSVTNLLHIANSPPPSKLTWVA